MLELDPALGSGDAGVNRWVMAGARWGAQSGGTRQEPHSAEGWGTQTSEFLSQNVKDTMRCDVIFGHVDLDQVLLRGHNPVASEMHRSGAWVGDIDLVFHSDSDLFLCYFKL